MKRPDYNNPDDTFSGVVVIVATAVMVWMLMFAVPYGVTP